MLCFIACVPEKAKKWITLLGCVLLHSTLACLTTSGNMTPYIASYLRAYSNGNGNSNSSSNQTDVTVSDINYSKVSIIFTAVLITMSLTSISIGLIRQKIYISSRLIILIGCFIMDVGQGLTYFTIRHSLIATIVTFGVMNGVGIGLSYLPPIAIAMRYFHKNKGFSNSAIYFGLGVCGIVLSQFQSVLINPNNVSPDEEYNGQKYFSKDQLDVLDRVPNIFLYLAALNALIHSIGLFIIIDNEGPPKSKKYDDEEDQTSIVEHVGAINDENAGHEEQLLPDEQTPMLSAAVDHRRIALNSLGVAYNDENAGMTLKETLKYSHYYKLASIFVLINMAPVFVLGYFKAFGETFIKDDRFLSTVGSVGSIMAALGSIFWGQVADKLSYKLAILIINTIFIAFVSTYFLISYVESKIMFLIWTSVIQIAHSGVMVENLTVIAKTFGQKNFSAIYAPFLLATIPTSIVTTTLNQSLDMIGFFWLFTIYAGFGFIGLIITLTFSVKDQDGYDI